MFKQELSLLLLAGSLCFGQNSAQSSTFEGFPSVTLSNGKLQLTLLVNGSTLANLILADDPDKLSPYWDPFGIARRAGREPNLPVGDGHFLCVDGFGPSSREERAAGLPGHGGAHLQTFAVETVRDGSATVVTMRAKLPIVQENLTRTFRAVDGENVIYVDSELESLLGFDRPVNWAEHATLGSPFLEPGVTVVDLSGTRSRVRPYDSIGKPPRQRRLISGQDFTWPMAPGLDGSKVNVRETPQPSLMDHLTTLLDPNREFEWVTAINRKKHLMLGYVFLRQDYPWLQYWGDYPEAGNLARGMELSTQPFDVPRREAITANSMFETPTYRWLPAKSKIGTHFLLFYAHVPDGFDKVDDVTLSNGKITIEDRATHQQVTLAASRGLAGGH